MAVVVLKFVICAVTVVEVVTVYVTSGGTNVVVVVTLVTDVAVVVNGGIVVTLVVLAVNVMVFVETVSRNFTQSTAVGYKGGENTGPLMPCRRFATHLWSSLAVSS